MAHRWKVALKGRMSDFMSIQGELRVSDFRLIEKDGSHYLVGQCFDKINTNQEVYEEAKELIADINLSFQFARPNFTAIDFGGFIVEKYADGSSVTHQWTFVRGI